MTPSNRYADTELLAGLRDAAGTMGEPLTVNKYNSYRAARPELASGIWIIRHFKSWVEACGQAGIQVNKTRSTSTKWTDHEMLSYVAAYMADSSSSGAYGDYESWSATVDDAPSGPSLRARLGRWSDIKKLALELDLT